MVAEIAQYSVESCRVQFAVVNEQQYQETRQSFMIKQLTASELLIAGGSSAGQGGHGLSEDTATSDAAVDGSTGGRVEGVVTSES